MFKKQSRPITTLHDFAKNNYKTHNDKAKAPDVSLKRSEQSKFGLSTLLHFNNHSTISSIRSKIDLSRVTIQSPQFGLQAKLEIQELKSKRLQLERKWGRKQIKQSPIPYKIQSSDINQSQQIQNSLDESEVQVYSMSLQKTKYEKNLTKSHIQDRFILDLKSQIKADRANQLIQKIKRVFLKQFLIILRKYFQIVEFRQKCRMNLLKMIFQEWKQLADKSVERQQLRALIVQKIKKRKVLKESSIQPNIDNITI